MKRLNLFLIFLLFSFNIMPKKIETEVSIIKIIPGVFQLKEKKIIKGSLLLSSFVFGILGAIVNNNDGNNFHKQYLLSENINEVILLREKTEKKFRTRNLFLIGTGVVFLTHLFDLKFSNKSGVKGEIENNNINLGIYYKF